MANFNFNKVILGGRLTADPELKTTTSGIVVTSFSIAVSRRFTKNSEGQASQQSDFINCVAWRNQAEFITRYFRKGQNIGLSGSIQTRTYQDKDTGKNRTAFDVVINNAYFVESKGTSQNTGFGGGFNNYQETAKPAGIASSFSTGELDDFSSIASDDGDLPF
ncbi:MAG: single-stranded DNA-binding protein [Oscillospiraceae bacterium]|nr:single-stranded DNA-binding protein [Oscillospiraceae bacterium]